MATDTTSGGQGFMGGIPADIMDSGAVRAYLGGISEDTLRLYVGRGLPVFWTGLAPGKGHRLFHRAEVDAWVRARLVVGDSAAADAGGRADGEGPPPPAKSPRPTGRKPARAAGDGRWVR